MRYRFVGLWFALLVVVGSRELRAQPTPDALLMARADSITVGDYCRLAQRILAARAVVVALADDSSDTRAHAAVICDPLLSSFTLLAVTGRAPAPIAAVARLRTQGYTAARSHLFESMQEFRASVRAPDLVRVVAAAIGDSLNAEFIRVSTTAQGLLTSDARDRALARLAKYERKLGPTSAKLNGIEVVLNYAAQRWIPGFKPTPLRGPSPWEVVAAYTPAYLTRLGTETQAVSASEFGLRYYLFCSSCGKSGFEGIIKPTYLAAGVLTASDRNGALVWPWDDRTRTGAYVSLGDIKIGYIKGRKDAWLVSKQFQAVRFLF